ncbi:MAG: DUF4388 domain-containing protein [Verrucomicrobiota bacterium]
MTYFLIRKDNPLFELPVNVPVTIGRAAVNQIVLNDHLVSRIHAKISPTPSGPHLIDRGSANGVKVNGAPVWEAILQAGDEVQIGSTVFQVVAGTRAEAQQRVANQTPANLLGDLAGFHIISLLQTLVEQGQTGALTLTQTGQLQGKIYFFNGTFAHAETTGGLQNQAAIYELMRLRHGQFVFQPAVPPPATDIEVNPAELILEGCERLTPA